VAPNCRPLVCFRLRVEPKRSRGPSAAQTRVDVPACGIHFLSTDVGSERCRPEIESPNPRQRGKKAGKKGNPSHGGRRTCHGLISIVKRGKRLLPCGVHDLERVRISIRPLDFTSGSRRVCILRGEPRSDRFCLDVGSASASFVAWHRYPMTSAESGAGTRGVQVLVRCVTTLQNGVRQGSSTAGHIVFGGRIYLESTEPTGEYTGSNARPDKLVLSTPLEIAAPLRPRS